jgi:hypothetical protein
VTIDEAAKFLFVSRQHLHSLLASGKLAEVLPRKPSGQLDIEATSVEAYRTRTEAAQRTYLNSQTQHDDPLGFQASVTLESRRK